MIVDEKVYDIQTNVEDAMEFEIALTSKAFQQLSSNLYSKPYLAVMRELGTNAIDSLVAAGKPNTKFDVHLPNKFEPWVEVSDKGSGMDEQQIRTLYRKFFDSNKIQSNELTGCLGLGSKSPLAVTDQFSVQSRYNGTEYLYQVFINQKGIPALSKIYDKPTTEENGFSIRFAVKQEDFDKFCEAAIDAYSVFDNPPNVVGNSNYRLKAEPDYFVKTQEYAVHKSHKGCSYVIMGNVSYPIVGYEIGYDYNQLLSHGIVIFAPIGSVNFTPSRESLHYDLKTKEYIRNRMKFIMEDMDKQAEDKLKDCKTKWEARKVLYEIAKMGFVNLEPIFQGEKITQNISVNKVILKYQPTVNHEETFRVKEYELTYKRRGIGDKLRSTDRENLNPGTIEVSKLYIADIPEASIKNRVKLYLETQKNSGSIVKIIVLFNVPTEFIKDEGIEVVNLSTLPKPIITRKAGIYTRSAKSFMYYWMPYHGYSKAASNYWKEEEVSLSEGGVYVEINRFHYTGKNGAVDCEPEHLDFYQGVMKDIIGEDFKIYGIRSLDLPKLLKKTANNLRPWTKLWDFVSKIVKRYEHWQQDIALHKELESLGYNQIRFWKTLGKMINHPKVEKICEYLKYERLETNKEKYNLLCVRQGVDIQPSEVISPLVEEFLNTYPLLKPFAQTSHLDLNSYRNSVVQYIEIIDEAVLTFPSYLG